MLGPALRVRFPELPLAPAFLEAEAPVFLEAEVLFPVFFAAVFFMPGLLLSLRSQGHAL